jgi:hypothetical protein
MSLPMNRPSTSVVSHAPDGFSRAEGRTLVRLQNRELTHGIVAATRVQAAATVTGIGMQCAGMFSREARFQENGDPAAANRLQHIADEFAVVVGAQIARFGY